MPVDLFASFAWFVTGVGVLGGLGMWSDRLIRSGGPAKTIGTALRRTVMALAIVGACFVLAWYLQVSVPGQGGPEV